MILLEYGILYDESDTGMMFTQGDHQVFLVTEYSTKINSIRHNFVIAKSYQSAWDGVTKQSNQDPEGYKVLSVASLYEMLQKLVKVVDDEKYQDGHLRCDNPSGDIPEQ